MVMTEAAVYYDVRLHCSRVYEHVTICHRLMGSVTRTPNTGDQLARMTPRLHIPTNNTGTQVT